MEIPTYTYQVHNSVINILLMQEGLGGGPKEPKRVQKDPTFQ